MKDHIVQAILQTIPRVIHPQLWVTEPSFVAQFNAEFQAVVRQIEIFTADVVTQQEYQKRLRVHGLRSRPDLIVHIPYNPSIMSSWRQGNFVVFEFKNRGYRKKAQGDLKKLDEYIEVLDYDMGVFININRSQCYLDTCELSHWQRIHEFASARSDNELTVNHAFWTDDGEYRVETTKATFPTGL